MGYAQKAGAPKAWGSTEALIMGIMIFTLFVSVMIQTDAGSSILDAGKSLFVIF
jgi:hypothetical protein